MQFATTFQLIQNSLEFPLLLGGGWLVVPALSLDGLIRDETVSSCNLPVCTRTVDSGRITRIRSEMPEKNGATRQDRTGDLLITNQPLYQLS